MAWNENLEALKGLVAEAAQTAARVTKSAASVTKSNISILGEQEKQRKAYLELGKLYYRDFITGEEPDDAEYLPLCDAITEAAKNIDSLRGARELAREDVKSAFARPAKPECEEEKPSDLEAELAQLHRELDELERDLAKMGEMEEQVEAKADEAEATLDAVFEVVDDEEPK